MVRGPMGALACSEWGTRSCTDIPCQGKGTGHSQTQTQGEPCLGPEDILVRDMALALSGYRAADRLTPRCSHKGHSANAFARVCGKGRQAAKAIKAYHTTLYSLCSYSSPLNRVN